MSSRFRPRSTVPPSPPAASFAPVVERRHVIGALVATFTVIAGGTLGFVLIEGWSFWKSLYFTLITITTVGYGDEGISTSGRVFASILLVGGIGVASYTFAIVVQSAVASQMAWRKRMQKRIDKLRDHAILCGFGRMGQTVYHELQAAKLDVVVIEKSHDRICRAGLEGLPFVEGDAGEDEVLQKAGIERAKYLVAAAGGCNLVITLSARDLAPDVTIIARAEGDEEVRKLHRAGADRTVSPYHCGGLEIAAAITRPLVADFLAHSRLAGGNLALAEINVREGSPLVGRTLADHGRSDATRVSYVVLERVDGEQRLPPMGSDEFRPGDRLVVAGDPEQVARMKELGRSTASRAA